MIDLDALAREAANEASETVTVERSLLALVHAEIHAGRIAQAQLDQIFQRREPALCTAATSAT